MNIAISNLAFRSENDIEQCSKHSVDLIEIAPTKIDSWENLTSEALTEYRNLLQYHQKTAYSMQSLYYGVKITSDEDFLSHFSKILEIAKILEVKILVFGSPSLRRHQFDYDRVFKSIDNLLEDTEIKLCIEPNSRIYNGEFFFTLEDIIRFLNKINSRNIYTMIDTHNIIFENLDPCEEFLKYQYYIHHVHVSEYNLTSLKDLDFHKKFSNVLKKHNYNKVITYELANITADNLDSSLRIFSEIYS